MNISYGSKRFSITLIRVLLFPNPSFTCQSVMWMETKGAFARDFARLAKFWSQTILFDGGKVFGMSYIFELVAVKAAMEGEEEKKRRRSEPTFEGALR